MSTFSFWKSGSAAVKMSDSALEKEQENADAAVIEKIDLETRNQDPLGFCVDKWMDVEKEHSTIAGEDNPSTTSTEPCIRLDGTIPVDAKLETSTMEEGSDRDSGVYLSDDENLSPSSQPVAASDEVHSHSTALSRSPQKPTASMKSAPQRQTNDATKHRLRRPAELNLSPSSLQNSSKPRSELEQRHDVIRNSKTQSKAALRSPTALLQERLNIYTRSEPVSDQRSTFKAPPRSESENGACFLPGPGASAEAFSSTSVRARTEAGNKPAWWCKIDKLVVFDGIEVQDEGDVKIHTRTSKGLSIARRLGDMETIVIPMGCEHCQEMLKRHEWKYDMRVCKRSVCGECRERCRWEEQEAKRVVASRDRADSLLQAQDVGDGDLMRKVGIEQGRPKSLIETLDGIEERMESV